MYIQTYGFGEKKRSQQLPTCTYFAKMFENVFQCEMAVNIRFKTINFHVYST